MCDSENLYYGYDIEPNYVAALNCAKSGAAPRDDSDVYVLMMLHANGQGVPKDVALAKAYACSLLQMNRDDRELSAMVEALSSPLEKFDLCDFAQVTPSLGRCASISAKQKTRLYRAKIAAMKPKAAVHIAKFEMLSKSAKAFIEARAQNEVDRSGTGRAMFVMNEADIQWRDFIETLSAITNGKLQPYTAKALSERELWIKEQIANLESLAPGSTVSGTVKVSDVIATQVVWKAYRDAASDYAKTLGFSDLKVKAWLSAKRHLMLKSLTSNLPASSLSSVALTYESFAVGELPKFAPDTAPESCKETSKRVKNKRYDACIVNNVPYFIRMSDEGSPWAVLYFKGGRPVQYEGIENPNVRIIKNGNLYAVINTESKTFRTSFADDEGKALVKQTKLEVEEALAAFNFSPSGNADR